MRKPLIFATLASAFIAPAASAQAPRYRQIAPPGAFRSGETVYFRSPDGKPAGSAWTPSGGNTTYFRDGKGRPAGSAWTPLGGRTTYYRDGKGRPAGTEYRPFSGRVKPRGR